MIWDAITSHECYDKLKLHIDTHLYLETQNSRYCGVLVLTQWGQDEIDSILQTTFSNAFFLMKIILFWLNFTEICWQGANQNNPVLVQIMAWRWSDDRPLSEPEMGYLADAYMRHWASMSHCIWLHGGASKFQWAFHNCSDQFHGLLTPEELRI